MGSLPHTSPALFMCPVYLIRLSRGEGKKFCCHFCHEGSDPPQASQISLRTLTSLFYRDPSLNQHNWIRRRKTSSWFCFALFVFFYIANMQTKPEWSRIKPSPSGLCVSKGFSHSLKERERQKYHVGNLKQTKDIANICMSWFGGDGASRTSQDVSDA